MHQVFDLLDLSRPSFTHVREEHWAGNEIKALEELLNYYQNRKDYQGFIFAKGNGINEIRKQMEKIPEIEKQHILKIANQVGDNTFLFDEPWDMERTKVAHHFEDEIDWQLVPDYDPEWTFMLNRMNYLNVLAQAYLLTGDHHYTEIYMYLVADWLEKNKETDQLRLTSWRSIDSAIRLRNWIKSLEVFLCDLNFSAKLLADMIVSCVDHMEYLQTGWTINRLQTNWVVLETNGAYLVSLFFKELIKAKHFERKSLAYATRAALTQETSEGMHWEQSYQYHHEVLLKLAEIYLLGLRNNKKRPTDLLQVIKRMSLTAAHIRKPDGTQENYGDSDREHVDELLVLLEQITGLKLLDNHLVAIPNRFVLTHFGYVEKPKEKEQNRQYNISHALDEAGIYLLKDYSHQFHAQFKCGFLGHGHGHDDLLHVSVFDDGEDLLVDAGRYSYEEEHHNRLAFKSQSYHNTPMVDNQPINSHKNCWDAKKVAHQVNSKYRFHEKIDFVEGGHLGYLDLSKPIYTNRKVIYLKPDILVLVDEFLGSGKHTYTQNLHFKLNNLTKIDNFSLLYKNSKGKKYPIQTFVSDSQEINGWKIEQQAISDDYNEQHLAPKATLSVDSLAPFTMCTFVGLTGKDLSIEPVPVFNEYECLRKSSTVSAFKIGTSRYLVINHYEDADSRRAYIVDGHQAYGRVVLIETDNQREEITRVY